MNFVNFWKEKSHRFAMGFSYLSASEYSLAFDSWSARKAIGTGFSLWNARSAWNARKALLRSLYCSLAGDIISVLYPLRSIRRSAPSGTPEGLLEQASAFWNALRPLEQSLRLYLERPQGSQRLHVPVCAMVMR